MDVLKSFLDRLASFDLWAVATILYAVGVKVCGNNFWPVLFLTFLMIAFDTLTRWDCICKKYIMDHNPEETKTKHGVKSICLPGLLAESVKR